MVTEHTLDHVDRELSVLRRASWSGWGKVPTFVEAPPLIPPLRESTPRPPQHDAYTAERVARAVRRARVHMAQQNALDAPFRDIARARAEGFERPARWARGPLKGLGLVSNATSDTQAHVDARRLPREKLVIHRDAQRIKRLRTTVSHVARMLHFDAHRERHAQRWNKKFITLTYAKTDAWRPGHISAYRKALREWCVRRKVKCRYVWVAEIQEDRGAVHYHLVVWLPKGKFLPFADVQGWWPHGSTNIKTAQSPISYIAKYASKTTAGQASMYPKGTRMHGHGGMTPPGREELRYWIAPFWVRDAMADGADIRKVVGGYMNKHTGEFLPSPWRVVVGPGGQVWAYRIDQLETMQ